MGKLKILGRTNWEKGFYVKFKAEEKSIIVIKKIVKELGSYYFIDNHVIPRTSSYEKWKDQWIPVYNPKNKELDIDIICGDKVIHMLVHKCPSFEFMNKILDKYAEFIPLDKWKKNED